MSDTTLTRTSDREIVITRTFRAPPRLVFTAFTDAEHVRKWWAPKSHGTSIKSCEAEVRVGGKYRYVLSAPHGEVAFSGKYIELTPPSRVVYSQVFEAMADAGEAVITVVFDAAPNEQTKMTSTERYPSKEALDGALESGMESGMRETMDQLDALVLSMR